MSIYKRIEFFVKSNWKILAISLGTGIFWAWASNSVTALKLIPTVLAPQNWKQYFYNEPSASIIIISSSLVIGIIIAILRRRK